MRMCGTIATEILITVYELNFFDIHKDYECKTRFSETRKSSNDSDRQCPEPTEVDDERYLRSSSTRNSFDAMEDRKYGELW